MQNSKPLKDLLKLKLIPPNRWSQPGQLPLSPNLPIEMFNHSMSMSLVLHNPHIQRRISLMRGSQLMMANDFIVGDFLPFGGADVVLGVDEGVAHEANVRHNADEIFCRHGIPFVAVDVCVIDLRVNCVSWCIYIQSCWKRGILHHESWCKYSA